MNEYANSRVKLKKANKSDAEELLKLQRTVFMPIYQKYEDHETSPVNQTMDRFIKRFDIGDYYKIMYDESLAGSVFVYQEKPGVMKFHIINILEEFQNKGIAQKIMKMLEGIYPQADIWKLETIESEKRNCYLYEKMGYVKTPEKQVVNGKLTLITYIKVKKN